MKKTAMVEAVEAAAAMAGFKASVFSPSDIYGMPREDRATVVLQCDVKRERESMWAACKELRSALREAGFGMTKVKRAEGPLHMGYPLRWVCSFDVGIV